MPKKPRVLFAALVIVMCGLLSVLTAQPVTPPGMRVVTHGSAFTGSGTVASPLNLAPQACAGSGSAVSGWGSDGAPTCVAAGATYTAGDGLGLSGTVFSLLSGCSDGQIPKRVSGAWACASDSGGGTLSSLGAISPGRLDNWAPSGLAPNAVIQAQSYDNEGTLITGISATGFSLGNRFTLCNANAPQDDGILTLAAESTSSTAGNRIWTPDFGRTNGRSVDAIERYTIGPSSCVDLVYLQPDATDVTTKRWVVVDNTRFANVATRQLELFPIGVPAAIMGTVNDWTPDDTCPGQSGPQNGSCEAGASTSGNSYTFIYASTVDSAGATLTGLSYRSSSYADGQQPIRIIYNAGPGDIRLADMSNGSVSLNRFGIRFGDPDSDLVLKPKMAAWLYHLRDSGQWIVLSSDQYLFDAREVNVRNGLSVKGSNANILSGQAAAFIDHSATGETKDFYEVYVRDVGSYNTTAATRNAFGISSSVTATRSAGSNQLINVALLLGASGGQQNQAIRTTAGDVYFGQGSQMTYFYVNTQELSSSGQVKSQGNLTVGSSAFGGTTAFTVTAANGHVTYFGTAPTLSGCTSKCTIDAAATDERGRIACTDDSGSDCTVTFASAFATNAPLCSLTFEGSTAPTSTPYVRSVSTTAFTFDQNATGTHGYSYHCDGML